MDDEPKLDPATSGKDGAARRAFDFLAIAVFFGLVMGFLEGFSQTFLQGFGGMSWNMLLTGTSVRIIWAAPLFYAPLFLIVGALFAGAHALAPQWVTKGAAVFALTLVCFAN